MIKYKLICKDCDSLFDSWFPTSKEYDKLKRLNHLNCHLCTSLNVEKTLMSPSVLSNKKEKLEITKNKKYTKIKNKIKEYQNFIKDNFKYVGENFAFEARSIHYNNKKSLKGIYGTASIKEVKELRDEGIEAETLPWVKEQNN